MEINHISPKEAFALCQQGAIIIDVRESFMGHFKTFDVENLEVFPMSVLSKEIENLPKNKKLIFADATGIKSKIATEMVIAEGISEVYNMAGGLLEWERSLLPTITYQKLKVSGRKHCEFVHKDDVKKQK